MIQSLVMFKMKAEKIREQRERQSLNSYSDSERKDSTDREALEADVQRRDERVKELEHEQAEKEKALTEMQNELNSLKRRQMENSYMHSLEVGRLKRENEAITKRVETFKRDMEDENAVQDYATLVREMSPKIVGSTYVMKLKAQLMKATKKMEGMTEQMVIIQESCDEVVDSILTDIQEIVEERCVTELELINQHAELSERKREMESEYEAKIAATEDRINEMKSVIEKLENGDDDGDDKKENGDSKNHPDDAEKNEEEEKKDASELKKFQMTLEDLMDQKAQSIHNLRLESREKKEKILKLQRINEKQEETIEKLIAELDALNNDIDGEDSGQETTSNCPELVDDLSRAQSQRFEGAFTW